MKYRILVFGILILFGVYFLKFGTLASAQGRAGTGGNNASGTNTSATCSDTGDPEFHSLRPYPAKPCIASVSDYAYFCGDSITITDTITRTYIPGTDNCTAPNSSGKVTCTYSERRTIPDIKIDLSDATLPFMGNTEDVINSQNPTGNNQEESETLGDPEKVNNYVSWYLNGVTNKAEYKLLDSTNVTDISKIVNFSGPINKLLPQEIQFVERINTINQAKVTMHDQVVGCSFKLEGPSFLGLIGNLFGTLRPNYIDIPFPCYINPVTQLLIDSAPSVYGFNIKTVEHRLSAWTNEHLPPLRSEYTDYTEYLADYERWRGKSCAVITLPTWIPIVGGKKTAVCAENIYKDNFYSQLFPYIPLSSTEDLAGSAKIATTVSSTADVTINDVNATGLVSPTLYFAHMQESSDLASQLQSTYLYKDADGSAPGKSIPPQVGGSCSIIDVRSNKGDSLLATPITGSISYTATFTCDFDTLSTSTSCTSPNFCAPTASCTSGYNSAVSCGTPGFSCCYAPTTASCASPSFCAPTASCTAGSNPAVKCGTPGFSCCKPTTSQTCTRSIPITLAITTQTPLANEVWNKLVAGSASVFRRMFPKLGAGSSLGELKDIPASTVVTYSGGVSGTGQLNFPHIGGVSEYFLKGIQTMLRPKGYGEPISFAPVTGTTTSGEIDCDQSAPEIKLPNTISKETLNQRAINRSGEGNHILECYNDVVRKSLAAGISPAYTLFLWFNESGGSNYNISVQDFGINSPSVVGFTAQINSFLQKPSTYKVNYPECFGRGDDTAAFWAIYLTGHCTPEAGKPYTDLFTNLWSSISSCPIPKYPFGASCY
jgi:hypothetical protein